MQVQLDSEKIEQLSARGILAYVAVSIAWNSEVTTAYLAGLVKAQTATMLEGLNELSMACPEIIARAPKKKSWRCGIVQAGDGVVLQNSDSRRADFIDDLKKYWDMLNAPEPFLFNGKDGVAVTRMLRDRPNWTTDDWRVALNNRYKSVKHYAHATRMQPFWIWLDRLPEYMEGPLNQFGKSANAERDKTTDVRQRNREAVERAISNA
jgi:hypothetical protein